MPGKIRFWVPTRHDESGGAVNAGSTYLCNAAGEYAAIVFSVPRTGTLTRFEFNMAAVGVAPVNGVRCSFQDPSASTGLPDGTPDQSVTIPSGSVTTGWINPGDFSGTRAVTAGQQICAVVDNPSFTASDSFTLGTIQVTSGLSVPFGVSLTGTKQASTLPLFAIRYDDGTYEILHPELMAMSARSNQNIQSDTTPDEFGQSFILQRPYKMLGFCAHHVLGAAVTHDYTLYDAAGNVIASLNGVDSDVSGRTDGLVVHQHFWPTPVVLRPGHRYRWSLKPVSSTVNDSVYYSVFASLALMNAGEVQDWYACARTDGGAWTDYNSGTFRLFDVRFYLEDMSAARARGQMGM